MSFSILTVIKMGNECSYNKISLSSLEAANETDKGEQQNECKPEGRKKGTFREAVKNSVDIDPCEEENETSVEKVKEYKVLPPIRKLSNTVPQISYKPDRVWGGSVNSYLDTIHRDSIIDEDIITGRKKRDRRLSSLTRHNLRRSSKSGEMISWEKQITVLSEVGGEPPTKIEMAALEKRRRVSE